MSFFGAFTGSAQRKDLKRAHRDSDGMLREGYDQARGELDRGFTGAQTNYDRALADQRGGYQTATNAITQGRDQALGALDPYMQGSQQGRAMYENALGINGLGAQQQFGTHFAAHDPFRAQNADFSTEAMMRSLNARGLSGSGYGAQAVARENLRRGSEDYNNYLNRLQGVYGMGAEMAGQAAGISTQYGQNRAKLATGYADRRTGVRGDMANASERRGNSLANLDYGHAQQRAGQRTKFGNAMAEARGIGVNNLMGAAGLAIKAWNGGE